MFTMDTAFTVTNQNVQINTSQLELSDAFITVDAGDEVILETWTTDEDL